MDLFIKSIIKFIIKFMLTLQNNIIEPNNLIESSKEICLIKCKYYIANKIIC